MDVPQFAARCFSTVAPVVTSSEKAALWSRGCAFNAERRDDSVFKSYGGSSAKLGNIASQRRAPPCLLSVRILGVRGASFAFAPLAKCEPVCRGGPIMLDATDCSLIAAALWEVQGGGVYRSQEIAVARECKRRCGSAFHSADELPNVMPQDSAATGAKEKKGKH